MRPITEKDLAIHLMAALQRQDAGNVQWLLESCPSGIEAKALQRFPMQQMRCMLSLAGAEKRAVIFSEFPRNLQCEILGGLNDLDVLKWLEPFLPGEVGYYLSALPEQRMKRIEALLTTRKSDQEIAKSCSE